MTFPQVTKRAISVRDIYRELDTAISEAGGRTPCRGDRDFTATVQNPLDALELTKRCETCPVFWQCRFAALQLPEVERAERVMGALRFDSSGQGANSQMLLDEAKQVAELAAAALADSAEDDLDEVAA